MLSEIMKEQIEEFVYNYEVEDTSDITEYKCHVIDNHYEYEFDESEYREAQKRECIECIEKDTSAQYINSIDEEYCLKIGNNFENYEEATLWLCDIDNEVIKYIEEL